MTDQAFFTIDDTVRVRRRLREASGTAPDGFDLPSFIAMLTDEIEAVRRAGGSYDDVTRMIEEETGQRVDANAVNRLYAPRTDGEPNAHG